MDWQRIAHLSTAERQRLQNVKLHAFLRHQIRYSPHYRELFAAHDIAVADIRTTDDLVLLPFTTKEDLAPTEENRAKPRTFILQPDEHLLKRYAPKSMLLGLLRDKLLGKDVKERLLWEYKPIHLHFTTGRSALPTVFAYSARDVELLKESGRRLLDVSGVSRDEVGVNGFPYSPHLAFWLTYYAMTTVLMTGLPTGGGKVMGTEKIIETIERLKANALVFIPGYCYHLLRTAVAEGRDFSNVQHVLFGGERVSPGLREKMREMLTKLGAHEVNILATYAMTEGKTAWIQCAENTGYHLYPDLEFFEVVDQDGRRVTEGPGELVYTTLAWRGSVVVRYKTGDLTAGIEYGACPNCGKTVPRILPDLQRATEVREFALSKVKGELVNLNNFYPAVANMHEIEEWQVEIAKANDDPYEVDELRLYVALRDGETMHAVRPVLERRLEDNIGVRVLIIEEPLGKLLERLGMETELKEKRILDRRPKQ